MAPSSSSPGNRRPARPRSKTFDMMKLAICVGIGAALGVVFSDTDPLGVPSLAIGPALGVVVAHLWSKPEREAASRGT
ncbi:hypothetical protein [Modestobacter italicus]|uniref:hypothetical protein n=1 Tax=Modestobacter italicus (strain DSM 44449 / CECT 9708 / BC 501) TaxID=2732864 RepID=UPI001C98844E|nr:hypothetical protein [Modestobacter italicus]